MEFNFFFWCVFELVSPLSVANVHMFHSTGNVVIVMMIMMMVVIIIIIIIITTLMTRQTL
jgi:hypothetical protein